MRRSAAYLPFLVTLGACTPGTAAHLVGAGPSGTDASTGAVTVPETAVSAWTFLVYGGADTGSETSSPAFARDLGQVARARFGENVNIVIHADWTPSHARGSEWHEVTGDGATIEITDKEEELDFDDPAVLRASVERTFREHPARRHGVIVWTRSATSGAFFGSDTQDGTRPDAEPMAASAMIGAIREGAAAAGLSGVRPIDVLGFDGSEPGRVEVAFEAKDLAKVYIANAVLDGASSWPYEKLFTFLGQTPEADAEAFAFAESRMGSTARLHAAFDTVRLDGLGTATAALAGVLAREPMSADLYSPTGPEADLRTFVNVLEHASSPDIQAAAFAVRMQMALGAIVLEGGPATRFDVALPPASATSASWVDAYAAKAPAWTTASRWTELVRRFAKLPAKP